MKKPPASGGSSSSSFLSEGNPKRTTHAQEREEEPKNTSNAEEQGWDTSNAKELDWDRLTPASFNKVGVRRVNDIPVYILLTTAAAFLFIMMLVTMHRSKEDKEEAAQRLARSPIRADAINVAKSMTQSWPSGLVPEQKEELDTTLPPSFSSKNSLPSFIPSLSAFSSPAQGIIAHNKPSSVLLQQKWEPTSQFKNPAHRPQKRELDSKDLVHDVHETPEEAEKAFFSREKALQKAKNEPFLSAFYGSEEQKKIIEERQRDFTAAVRSSTRVAFTPHPSPSSSLTNTSLDKSLLDLDPSYDYLKTLEKIKDSLLPDKDKKKENPNDLSLFAPKGDAESRWKLSSSLEKLSMPCTIRTGAVIPALLLSSINSELPGMIMAQVSQSVYDTATGRCLVLPQGSRLIGSYSNAINYGQSRVYVAWQRIIFPNAAALDLGAMPGADFSGQAGLNDQVNNHYFRIFGSAFLMSAISAGFNYGKSKKSVLEPNNDWTSAFGDAANQQFSQATGQLLAKNSSISPTLTIRSGYRMNVIVTKDLEIPLSFVSSFQNKKVRQ